MESNKARLKIIQNWKEETQSQREAPTAQTELFDPAAASTEVVGFDPNYKYIAKDATTAEVAQQFITILTAYYHPNFALPDWVVEFYIDDRDTYMYVISNDNQYRYELAQQPRDPQGLTARLAMCFEDLRVLTTFEDDLMSVMMRGRRLDDAQSPTVRPISDLLFGAFNMYHLAPEFNNTLIENIYRTGKLSNLSGMQRFVFPWAISADIGKTLYDLIIKHEVKRSLEIGLAFGMSALFITEGHRAKNYGHHSAVDPCQSVEFQSMGIDQVTKAGMIDNFRLLEDTDYNILPVLVKEQENFDFIFIDGLHMHDYVVIDFFYSDLLLEVGGLMVFDDCVVPGVSTAVAYFENNRNYQYLPEYGVQRLRVYQKLSEDSRTITNPNHHAEYFAKSYVLSLENQLNAVPVEMAQAAKAQDIAIVGIDGSLPGGNNIEGFWQSIMDETVLYQRYGSDQLYRRQGDQSGQMQLVSAMIEQPFGFDPAFFKISHSEAQLMDPQLRLLLMSVQTAIEDSGYTPAELEQQRVGVFVGAENSDYNEMHGETALQSGYILNYSGSILANRLSYHFNFKGPCEVINTMCSSGAYGISRAVELLRSGEIDFAIVAAVKVNFSAMGFESLERLNIATKQAHCYSFHQDSQGYIRSEGAIAMVLTGATQAQQAGDHIYANIKQAARNFNGRDGHSMFSPSKNGQKEVIKQCYQNGAVKISEIDYIEAQGMGNEISDLVEFDAINEACAELAVEQGGSSHYPLISTIKPILGHMECVSALGALLKIILSFEQRKVFKIPQLTPQQVNPKLDIAASHCPLATEDAQLSEDKTMLAGLNSFGASGINVHLLLQQQRHSTQAPDHHAKLLVVSAKTVKSLQQYVSNIADFISAPEHQHKLLNLCHTFALRRTHHPLRVMFYLPQGEGQAKALAELCQLYLLAHSGSAQVVDNREASPFHFAANGSSEYQQVAMFNDGIRWLQANRVEFELHFPSQLTKVGRLPTYPFELVDCRLEAGDKPQQRAVNTPAAQLHPLLGHNTSNLQQQSYATDLTGGEFFVDDHQVNQLRVLPAVAYLEMARAAVHQASPNSSEVGIELQDVVFQQPIIVEGEHQVSIRLAVNDKQQIDFQIYSQQEQRQVAHCQGLAGIVETGAPMVRDLTELNGQMDQGSLAVEQLYQTYRNLGVVYGDSFRPLTQVLKGQRQVLAKMTLPDVALSSLQQFILHPSLMDGALQASLGLLDLPTQMPTQPSLPFVLERLLVLAPCTATTYAWVKYSQSTLEAEQAQGSLDATKTDLKMDIELLDEQGNVCVLMSGFTFRLLKGQIKATESAAESKPTANHLESSKQYQGDMALLQDHKLEKPVLMGAAYLAMMIDAASQKLPDQSVCIEKLLYANPLSLESGQQAQVQLLSGQDGPQQLQFVAYSTVSTNAEPLQVAQGQMELKPAELNLTAIDIKALTAQAGACRYGSAFYHHPQQQFYGPSLFSVAEVYPLADKRMLGKIKLTKTMMAQLAEHVVHPAIIDGCYIVGTFGLTDQDAQLVDCSGLPMMINSVSLCADLSQFQSGEYYCIARTRMHDQRMAIMDFELYTTDGQPLGLLSGVTVDFTVKNQAKALAQVKAPVSLSSTSVNISGSGVEQSIIAILAAELKLDPSSISVDQPFADFGVDSITGITTVRKISEALNIELEMTSLFEHSSVKLLTNHIVAQWGDQLLTPAKQPVATPSSPAAPALTSSSPNTSRFAAQAQAQAQTQVQVQAQVEKGPVAVVGMSGRFAESDTVEQLWQHLKQGKDLVTQVTRWAVDDCVIDDQEADYCSSGSFVEGIDLFDADFFRISSEEARYMDPQQRLFLQESYRALEDAGYGGEQIEQLRCGVYVGCGSSNYDALFGEQMPGSAFWGNAASVIPARIAYYLNLHGPAIAVDTACSSSLVAIHLACQSLWTNETDMALAGGVCLQATPSFFQVSNRAGMLSPSGKCRSFDGHGDGIVPGEAVAAVVLKRLADAQQDGDAIVGVIIGSGVNQDGASNGLIAPSAQAQQDLQQQVFDQFNINPQTIQMVEAHGTGTILGDSIEYNAMCRSFGHYGDNKQYCALGSLKSNIGHAATAAGIAGVIKLLLAIKHQQIPASLHFDSNPAINLSKGPFYINDQLQDWQVEPGHKRRGAISSFGFSGTNAHMVIEQPPQRVATDDVAPGYVVVLSAKSAPQLRQQISDLVAAITDIQQLSMHDLSYTLLMGRRHFNHRLACVAVDKADLLGLLQQWLHNGSATRLYSGSLASGKITQRAALKNFANHGLRACSAGGISAEEYLEHLETASDLFVEGYQLKFASLFTMGANRMSLPTYPFAKQRHWVDAQVSNGQVTTAMVQTPAQLHPLLHVNSSDLSQISFTTEVDHQQGLFTRISSAGVPAVPAAIYLEMVIAALDIAVPDTPHRGISMEQLSWGEPLLLTQPQQLTVALINHDHGVLEHEVYTGKGAATQVYAQGKIKYSELAPVEKLDIKQLRGQMTQAAESIAEFYQRLAKAGLEYEASAQGISRVDLAETQLLAELKPIGAGDQQQLATLWIDSALQTCAWLVPQLLTPSMPIAAQSLSLFGQCPSQALVWLRHGAGDQGLTLDLDICDSDGNVWLQLRGIQHADAAMSVGASLGSTWQFGTGEAGEASEQAASASMSVSDKASLLIKQYVALQLDQPLDSLATDLNFFELGVTSLGIAGLVQKINELLDENIPPSLIFEHRDIDKLSAYLSETYPDKLASLTVIRTSSSENLNDEQASQSAQWPILAPLNRKVLVLDGRSLLEQEVLSKVVLDDSADVSDYEKLTF